MSAFFIPKKQDTGTMWDTWLYWHGGSYYLYYLAKSGPKYDNISLAPGAGRMPGRTLSR